MKPWREELLAALSKSGTQYAKGEELAGKFGFSRAALWKKISVLRAEGHPIEAVTNRGYRMSPKEKDFELQVKEELAKEQLEGIFEVHVVDTTPSTNLLAREAGVRGDKEIGVFVALQQTAGRGRRGRTWISNTEDGLWFSFLLRPEAEPGTASMITLLFGLCILKAIQKTCNIPAGIKWPNDIISLHNGKKLCGILSETSMEDNRISYAVVGCGINVLQTSFPEDIEAVATSIHMEGAEITRTQMLAAVLREVAAGYRIFAKDPSAFLPEYRANCATLGRTVRIESASPVVGTAQDISYQGDLLVRSPDGTTVICRSGEVSVRGMLGYL